MTYNRNKVVRDIIQSIRGQSNYYFNPVDGTISHRETRAARGTNVTFKIVDTWYPMFDKNNEYTGYKCSDLGFVEKEKAEKQWSKPL